MSDDNEFEDEESELDEGALDDEVIEDEVIEEDDLDEDLPDDDAELAEVDVVDVVDVVPPDAAEEAIVEPVVEPATEAGEEEDEVVVALDDELHPDDIEEPLDAILQERTAAATLEDEEEEVEEEVETDERGEAPAKILPRRPGEFLCQSCFLVLPRNQLADEARMFCRDCA